MNRFQFLSFFILISMFWGGSFFAIHIAIGDIHPYLAATLRSGIGFLTLCVILLFKRVSLKNPVWKISLTIGLFSIAFPWTLLFWGEKFVAPALASIINSTTPLFVGVMAPYFTPDDELTYGKIVGALLGLIGVVVIFAPEASTTGGVYQIYGMLALLGMAFSYAVGILLIRRVAGKVSNNVNLLYNFGGATLFMILFTALSGHLFDVQAGAIESWVAVAYLGVFSSALAMMMFYVIIERVGSMTASAVTYLVPVVAIAIDYVFLHKALYWNQGVGAVIVLLALVLIRQWTTPIRRDRRAVA